jgi:hypothetical protein
MDLTFKTRSVLTSYECKFTFPAHTVPSAMVDIVHPFLAVQYQGLTRAVDLTESGKDHGCDSASRRRAISIRARACPIRLSG